MLKSSLRNAMREAGKVEVTDVKKVVELGALTENGATTLGTSGGLFTDLFFQAGAARAWEDERITLRVWECAEANLEITLKLLFWVRDVRGGAGERKFFRVGFKALVENYADKLKPIVKLIPVYGRWDDLFVLFGTPLEDAALEAISSGLLNDNTRGLVAKWLPRHPGNPLTEKGKLNTLVAKKLRQHLGIKDEKTYRKMLVGATSVVEQKMCAKQWDEIKYATVPSKATTLYRKAFLSHNEVGYKAYIESLVKGETKVNSSTSYPHDLAYQAENETDRDLLKLLDAQWNALPNYLGDSGENILCMVDTSGSMTTTPVSPNSNVRPIHVSVALGLYTAERNKGAFKNCVLTFSSRPALAEIKGDNLKDKLNSIRNIDWGMSTDLQAAFQAILTAAKKYDVPKDEMPTKIFVISDMEFNSSYNGGTNHNAIKAQYESSGYELPTVIYWNVQARGDKNFPTSSKEKNVALISGFSPSIIKYALKAQIPTPEDVMMETLGSERYAAVTL